MHVINAMASGVEVLACCFCEVFIPHIAFMFCKSVFESSFCFTYILHETFHASDQVNDVTGGTCNFCGDLMLVWRSCRFHMITYHGVVAVNISVASSHSKKLSLRSFCHWGNLPSIGNKRRIRENFLHVWILCHHSKMFSHNSIHIWKSWVIMYDKYWSVCCLLSDHFFQGFQSRNLPCLSIAAWMMLEL